MTYCLCAGEPQHYEDAIKLGNGWRKWKRDSRQRRMPKEGKTSRKRVSKKSQRTIKWEIQQLDIPTAFLNGYVDDGIYIKTPDGFKNEPGKVLKLKRSLYSLRSAPRKWNERFHNFVETHGIGCSQ
ncbi:hypothetical protein PR048_015692 [Dryococelus australis]|uniref:Reverse transcriptase Ty1/copia-type domain-containing protein n=1 Tax=Dryococelus australis TaxID=614101 RepID=A0ABQ9HHV5_9NEOP|nr:hypothetical protein PR048_015692 [Dryococelus australis]